MMPEGRQSGTAWDRRLSDYAYTRGLDQGGWAWEFLRRNAAFRRDCRTNRAGHPVAIRHVSGAVVLRLRRRILAAEYWGLQFFADPHKAGDKTPVFWLAEIARNSVHCTLRETNGSRDSVLSLTDFTGQRQVLVTPKEEFIVISTQHMSACMAVKNSTLLFGNCAVTFETRSLDDASRTYETLRTLRRLRSRNGPDETTQGRQRLKYLQYLIALDGRLANRSYREIAEVLYGTQHVAPHWANDNRGYKSKVRRAVEKGIALMNGGYRTLL
jgi:hypothetical protein